MDKQTRLMLAIASTVIAVLTGINIMTDTERSGNWLLFTLIFAGLAFMFWWWMGAEERRARAEAERTARERIRQAEEQLRRARESAPELTAAAEAAPAPSASEAASAPAVEETAAPTLEAEAAAVPEAPTEVEAAAVPAEVAVSVPAEEAAAPAEATPEVETLLVSEEPVQPDAETQASAAAAAEETTAPPTTAEETPVTMNVHVKAEADPEAAAVEDVHVEMPAPHAVEAAVPEEDKQPAAPSDAPSAVPDDLTKIEGIGPYYRDILYKAGVTTYAALAKLTKEEIDALIQAAGGRRSSTTETWPEQASLAAAGRWDDLQALQSTLSAGRRKS